MLLALQNTAFFTFIQVPLYVIVSLALALLLQRAGRSAGFFRTIFFLPKMTPPVADRHPVPAPASTGRTA